MRTQQPFAAALKEFLAENEISQRELVRRCQRHGWGSVSTINFIVNGQMPPSEKAIEAISVGLGLDPNYWAEWRLAMARRNLDPSVVGLEAALRNLGE